MHHNLQTYDHGKMIWDAMEALNDLVDLSDPDLDLPNIQHLFQSAEAMRLDGRPDWMQVTALLHDLGKIMYLWGDNSIGTGMEKQYAIVGDTFVVGCALPATLVFPEFNELNPDMQDPRYNTDLGMYEEGCGLDNLTLTWGHDEYMYRVLQNMGAACKLPKEALWMVRYHSFYSWHTHDAYKQFLAPEDAAKLEAVRDFNKYDLYSKDGSNTYTISDMKTRYLPLLHKYLGKGPIFF